MEEVTNAFVGIAELAAVAFVEDEDDPLILEHFHLFQIGLLADSGIQFLQGRHDQLGVRVGELAHQLLRIAGATNAVFLELVKFRHRLVIQILAIHAKDHFVHVRQAGHDLCGLEGGQRLTRSRGVPDVAVGVLGRWILHALYDGLRGVVLIRTQHHQDLVRLVEHDVFADHRAEMLPVQEGVGKGRQFADGGVVLLRPVKGLLEALRFPIGLPRIGVILRVHPVADHEELDEVEQPVAAPEAVFLVTLDLVEGFLHLQPPAL